MRLSLFYPLLLLASQCLAQSPLTELPQCALLCAMANLPETGCNATDLPCLCSNKVFMTDTIDCARANCTVKEGLTALNITKTGCDVPVRDKSLTIKVLTPTFAALGSFFVAIRLATRWTTLGLDDAAIVVSVATGIGLAAMNYLLGVYGLGKDVWAVPFDDISKVLYFFYISEPLYVAATIFNKISLCLFMLRIFHYRNFRIMVWTVIGICAGTCIGFVFALIFQCSPIRYAWLGWAKDMQGSCVSRNGGTWANAILNIILDLVILALPLHQLRQLQTSYSGRKKFQIMIMFSVGVLTTIVSILRLNGLISFMNSNNYTYDNLNTAIWSTVEVFTGIICACLPAARVFFGRTMPKWMGVTTNDSSHGRVAYVDQRQANRPMSWNAISALGTTTRHGDYPDGSTRDFVRLEEVVQDHTSVTALKA